MDRSAEDELRNCILDDKTLAMKSLGIIGRGYSDAGMKAGGRMLPSFLFANFLSADQFEKIRHYAEGFAGILSRIADHICNDSMNNFIDIDVPEYGLFSRDSHCDDADMIIRLDMFFDGRSLKLVEYNCESPSGMGRIALIEKIYQGIPQLERFRNRMLHKFDTMDILLDLTLQAYRKHGGRNKSPLIALVDWKDVVTIADQEYIIRYFNSMGLRAICCEPGGLKYSEGKLYHGQDRIDIVFRRVIARELMERESSCRDFIQALKEGSVCVINPNISIVLNDKRLLDHLSRGSFDMLLDDEMIKIIRDIVPWTRKVADRTVTGPAGKKIKLDEYILENRERLVLKPGIGYGGSQVVLGCEADDNVWADALNSALALQDWVVQEYVDIPEIEVFGKDGFEKKYINLSPFVIGRRLSGFFTRVSDSKIINISKGGGLIPTYVLKK